MDHGLARGLTNYGDRDFALYLRRSFARSMGYSSASLAKPIVGIADSGSGFNNCHRALPELIESVKRGVLATGGLPLVFPTISLGEVFLDPTSMMYRNLMSMDVEEMVRAQPMDAVVLVGGCDKTVPAQLMGAASAGVPAIQLVAGPMMTGRWQNERLGACTDCRRFWARYRAGGISKDEIDGVESRLATTSGTCAVMGTASTMACVAETLGMTLPGTAAIPAVHADRLRAGEATGEAAVRLVESRITPDRVLTAEAIENALRVLLAIGGSTNAIIHLTAIAGRVGVPISLERLNTISDETLGDRLDATPRYVDHAVIRPRSEPILPVGGLVALFGSLAPGGAILKRSAADARLFETEASAVVFDSLEDLAARVDDPALPVTPESILVLKHAGPKGAPGMPEAGYLPIPQKLGRAGVKDMVRISDARMSGTAFGTIVLHVTPEAAVGGPLALAMTGDRIRLSVKDRRLDLLVDEAVLAKRRASSTIAPAPSRGYRRLYMDHVLQADHGCDFDFLRKGPIG